MGRVATYDPQEVLPKVYEGLRKGTPLTEICREPGLPSASLVGQWESANPDVAANIALARAHGFDAIAQAVRKTARGYGPALGGDSTGDVKRDRLIVDTDLKLLAKWDPRRYGEGFQLRMADADGNKIETSPKFLEALAVLRLAGGAPAQALVDVTPRTRAQIIEHDAPAPPASDDISDLL